VSPEQNSVTCLDSAGGEVWTYDFSAPLTCVDAAGGLFLAGALDGVLELLDAAGKRVFSFEPAGSRLPVIAGCALSRDGSLRAVVAGVDEQRFLLLERYGDSYRVAWHEFLGEGFRRPVAVSFVDGGRRVVFERREGLGIYDLSGRQSLTLALDGSLTAIDGLGKDGLLFVLTSAGGKHTLYAVKYPDIVTVSAPFEAGDVFLARDENCLYVGGGSALAAFELERE